MSTVATKGNTVKKTICFMIPFCIVFAGLAPGYLWAVPIAIGLAVIVGILFTLDMLEN